MSQNMSEGKSKVKQHTAISRRQFLWRAALMTTGGLLSACALPQPRIIPGNQLDLTYTEVDVPRPSTIDDDSANDTPTVNEELLARFMALSVLLTGVAPLQATVGRLYLHSLQTSYAGEVGVDELLELLAENVAQMPTSLAEIEQRGIFENAAMRALTDKITEYWYTGVYDTAEGGQALATYMDALAWQTLGFTKPRTVCGSYRFWTEPPEAALD